MDSLYFSQTLHDMHGNLTWQLFKCHYKYDLCIYEYLKKKKRDTYSMHNSHAVNAKHVLGYIGMYLYALHSITKIIIHKHNKEHNNDCPLWQCT